MRTFYRQELLKATAAQSIWPFSGGPKEERYIKTVLAEWAYVIAYQTSEERNRWLPCYLGIYTGHRCHMALGGLTPQQSLRRLIAE